MWEKSTQNVWRFEERYKTSVSLTLIEWLPPTSVYFEQRPLISKMCPWKSTKWIILTQIIKGGQFHVLCSGGYHGLFSAPNISLEELLGLFFWLIWLWGLGQLGLGKSLAGVTYKNRPWYGRLGWNVTSQRLHPASSNWPSESSHWERGLERRSICRASPSASQTESYSSCSVLFCVYYLSERLNPPIISMRPAILLSSAYKWIKFEKMNHLSLKSCAYLLLGFIKATWYLV